MIDISTNNKLTEAHVGHLFPMKCGHRGKPNASEEKLLENLLRASQFMNIHIDEPLELVHKVDVKSDT